MDQLERGTWIVNSTKHLTRIRTNAQELAFFEATEVAGKSGALLARLVAGASEVISAPKVKVFARESGITTAELPTCLQKLRSTGRIDFTQDDDGNLREEEIYSFSLEDALRTSADVYDKSDPSDHERASLVALRSTFDSPRFQPELMDVLVKNDFAEEVAQTTLDLQRALGLVQSDNPSRQARERIYYNEYSFADDPAKTARALRSLSPAKRQELLDIQQLVQNSPGYLFDALESAFSQETVTLMEGIGLIDVTKVNSAYGSASFVTSPQLKGISIGTPLLSADVFHKAKVLLSCLRYGEVKSLGWRGQISSYEKFMNILNKLLRGEWVGPCTAIGEDYQLLERDGVITTKPDRHTRYLMKLRQKEVGLLVKQMIEINRVAPEIDVELQNLLARQPDSYVIPEEHRAGLVADSTDGIAAIRQQLLHALRT